MIFLASIFAGFQVRYKTDGKITYLPIYDIMFFENHR